MTVIGELPKQIDIGEEIIFAINGDIGSEGEFVEEWLVLTEKRLQLFNKDGKELDRIAIDAIKEARLVHVIGGGHLIIDDQDRSLIFSRFTVVKLKYFSTACKRINNLVNQEPIEPLSEKDLPRYCETCKRPLPEGTNVCQHCVNKSKVARRLLQYAKPYRKKMTLASILLIITTLITLVPPYLTKIIVDDVIGNPTPVVGLLLLVIALGATQLLQVGLDILSGYLGVWVGSRLMRDLRKEAYDSLVDLSLSFFDRSQISQFIGRVNSDVESIRQFLTDGVMYITGQILMLLAIFGVMFSMDWRLTMLCIIPTPFIFLLSKFIWPYVRNRWYSQWRSINKLNMLVGDSLQGIRVVKAFGQEQQEKDRYHKNSEVVMDENVRTDGLWNGIFPIFSFVTGIGLLLVWYFGGQAVMNGRITLGVLMAFISYLGMFFGPLQWFSQSLNWMNQAFSSADRVFEIIDAKSEVPESPNPVRLEEVKGEVKFDQVTFGYEAHRPVLKDVSLTVQPGEMIGLVGHSGAGKSTLINLVSRFYDPNQGAISLDGFNLRDLKQDDLRQHIGVVLQETFLFDGTVAENICYSKADATPAEIMRAAKVANAHDFIVEMADGYDTRVGERGQLLSGGQKQRIAIARAILHNPKILILDEATASVDTETERKIQEALSRLIKGRTTIAIAHRLSTLRNANRLVVIDKGKVAEIGTHDELLEQEGIYHGLVQAQRELSQIKGVSNE